MKEVVFAWNVRQKKVKKVTDNSTEELKKEKLLEETWLASMD